MRIDGFQDIPAVLQSLKTSRSSPTVSSTDPATESSSLKLSSFGSVLQSVQRDVAAQAKLREAKVDAVSDAVQNGTLKMDLERLAARLVDLQVIDFRD